MNKPICMLTAATLAFGLGAATTFEISADRSDCTYAVGETVRFTVLATDDAGAPLRSGTVKWSLDNFGSDVIHASTSVDLADGNPFVVTGSLGYAGFLRLNVKTADGASSRGWSVAVDPTHIVPATPCPADFNAYWSVAKAKLESEVPLDAQMTLVPAKSTGAYNYYKVSFATFNGLRVYGFYTEPKDTSKTYPVRVLVPGAGPYHNSSWMGNDASVTLMVNVLPFEPSDDYATFEADYNAWNKKMMNDFGVTGSYGTAGIAESRESYVFYPILLGINRAVDWLLERPLVDTSKVCYYGGSQGGAFGFLLMGLNGKFTRGAMYIPAMCDHLSADLNRSAGWPHLIANQAAAKRDAAKANAPYFDAVNFARNITAPVRVAVGLADTTCPPAGGWCAYNALATVDKFMLSVPGMTHAEGSEISAILGSWIMGEAPAAPPTSHTESDGTTFVIADKVLTITVPSGVTSAYDFSPMVVGGAVTNIVVCGEGTLSTSTLSDYDGDFELKDSVIVRVRTANAFGRNCATWQGDRGTVRVGGSAAIQAVAGGSVTGKRIVVASAGPDGTGALRDNTDSATFQKCLFSLAADATVYSVTKGKGFTYGNDFDICGHVLTFNTTATWSQQFWSGNTFTNSTATPSTVRFAYNNWNVHFEGTPDKWLGGPENTVDFTGNYHYRLQRAMFGDWTLKIGGNRFCYGANVKNPAIQPGWTNNACCLPVVVKSGTTARLSDDSYNPMGHAMTFGTSLSGSGNIYVARGDTLHLATKACDYSGILVLMPPTNRNLKTTLMLLKGAKFTASAIKIAAPDKDIYGKSSASNPYTGCEIRMDGETVFALPGVTNTIACPLTITGGAAGSTIARIENTNTGLLTLDTSATIGTLKMTKGSLVLPATLATAPRIETLECASGVTADLGGKTLQVGTLIGAPVVTNGRIRTDAGGWDDDIVVTDPKADKIDDGTSRIYVFSNAPAGTVSMTLAKPFVLERYLVVGGGGSGGTTIAGGGGGGGLVQGSDPIVLSPGTASVTVGAGGLPTTESGSSYWIRGHDGERSSFVHGPLTILAYGGSSGAGWSDGNQIAGDFGSGGGCAQGGATTQPAGAVFHGGYPGGRSYGPWDSSAGGGGGGAGGSGKAGGISSPTGTAGDGGPGLDIDITGRFVNYAAGGGGGCGNKVTVNGAAGGASAGAGGGKAAPDGFGGGGGGGYNTNKGGKGGAGTVILRLAPCAKGVLVVRNAEGSAPGTLTVPEGIYALDDGESLSCGAANARDAATGIDAVCTGYTLETWNEDTLAWSAPVVCTGTTYPHVQSGTDSVRLTWQWANVLDYTHTDGTRFVESDRVLTVTVPADVTCTFNYAPAVAALAVTNIVLVGPATGSGALKAVTISGFEGDFTVKRGVDFQIACNGAFGKNYDSVADCKGTVRVEDGGQLTTNSGFGEGGVKGHLILFEGLGTSGKAAIWQGSAANSAFKNCLFRLTGDAVTWQTSGGCNSLYFRGGNVFDVNGYTLTEDTSLSWNEFAFSQTTWTNSNATAGSFVVKPNAMNFGFRYEPFDFWGGPQNTVVFQGNYCYRFRQPIYGDWTLEIKSCYLTSATGNGAYPAEIGIGWTNNVICLPIKVTGHAKFWDDSYTCEGGAMTVAGPISGGGTMSVARSDVLHIASKENTFSGSFYLYAGTNKLHNTTLALLKGSKFSASQIATGEDPQGRVRDKINPYTSCDILMDNETVFALPLVKNELNRCGLRIAGGAAGTTVGNVTHNTTGALVLDTPAILTSVTLSKGTLVVTNDISAAGTMPFIVNLTCGADTVLDLGGHDIEVGSLSGNPTVVNGSVAVRSATWGATTAGGAWGTSSNWQDGKRPQADGCAVVFPKAGAANVPVAVDVDSTLLSLNVGKGATVADGFAERGYLFSGSKALSLLTNPFVFVFSSGVNTLDSPIVGSGAVTFNASFHPATNSAAAYHTLVTVKEKALEGLTGKVTVNSTSQALSGKVKLETAKFGGQLAVNGGSAIVDSLAFVKKPADLTLNEYGTLVYTGPDVTIPGLTFAPAIHAGIETTNDLTVLNFAQTRTDHPLFKHGPGALRLLGTPEIKLTATEKMYEANGFSQWATLQGYAIQGKYCGALNISDGAVEIGVKDDPENAPALTLVGRTASSVDCALLMGTCNNDTRDPKFVLNNGTVTTTGSLVMNNWNQAEAEGTTKTVEVNGGSLSVKSVDSRLGWQWWPRSSHTYTVNGGAFTVAEDFNLTMLCPRDYAKVNSTEHLRLRESAARRCTVNGGTLTAGTIKMGYSFGRGWNYESSPYLSDGNGYGHGWQADAYVTVNGGTLTVTNYLLTADRADSRSWTILNGGTLKVNMVTNTVGKTGQAHLVLNGGTFAPTGDGDNADELVLKDTFATAVVSTNGAVFSTAFLPAGTAYRIEQPLAHDANCLAFDGGFTKAGAGELVLAAVGSTFTGPIVVNAGTLTFANRKAVPSKATELYLASSAKVGVASGKVRVKSLVINGQPLASGSYGSSASSADTKDDAHFSGSGIVQVGPSGICVLVR